jgi:gamma-glutamyltranspeptidase
MMTEKDLRLSRAGAGAAGQKLLRHSIEIMPPPSAGGARSCNARHPRAARRGETTRGSADELHLFIEASRRARQRFAVLDPDALPAIAALRRREARHRRADRTHAARRPPRPTPSAEVHPLYAAARAARAHHALFVADADGNVVSCDRCLPASGWIGARHGVIINNSVAAFGTAGRICRLPVAATSSMAPRWCSGTAVALVLGSPGGDTIEHGDTGAAQRARSRHDD